MAESKTIQVIKAVYHSDLDEYYSVQVWQKNDLVIGNIPGASWRTFGLQSETLEGLADVLAEAREFHAKVRIIKTTHEILELEDERH